MAFLVGKGDTEPEAVAAIPLYLGLMESFGYINEPTYTAMRDWGNSRSVEQIGVATQAMLTTYESLVSQAAKEQKDSAEKTSLKKDLERWEGEPNEVLMPNDEKVQNISRIEERLNELENGNNQL